MRERRPAAIPSLLTNKCPSCRKGNAFVNRSVFPLGGLLKLVDYCSVCGQKMKNEENNGGGINPALSMFLFFMNLFWYWPLIGLSYKDNSVYYFLATSIGIVILLQPWLMRFSRMIYLYLSVRYGNSTKAT